MAGKRQRIYTRTTKKGDVRYDVSFEFTDAVSGMRKPFMRTYKTLKEARQALAEHEARRGRGEAPTLSHETVATLCARWMAAHTAHVKPATVASYERLLRVYVVPYFGALPVGKLSMTRMEEHYDVLRGAGVGAGTIRNVHHRLIQILRWAGLHGVAVDASALQTRSPKYEAPEMRCLDDAQMDAFLAVAKDDDYGPIWWLALVSGMRRGELLGLKWEHIDWGRGELLICEARTRIDGHWNVGSTKNGLSRRISVPANLLSALRQHQKGQLAQRLAASSWVDHGLVFTNQCGGPVHPYMLQAHFEKHLAEAGLAKMRIHDLRHTHASFLLRRGKSVAYVSRRLGHKDHAQTLNVYAHCIPAEDQATADLLGQMFASS